MTRHIVNETTLAATATGSIIAATLTALTFALAGATTFGLDGGILIFVFGLVIGIPVALVVGVPVGFLIAWAVGFVGAISPTLAAATGGLAGLSLASAGIAIGLFRYASPSEYSLVLGGATLIGGMAGLTAYRVHFHPRADQ